MFVICTNHFASTARGLTSKTNQYGSDWKTYQENERWLETHLVPYYRDLNTIDIDLKTAIKLSKKQRLIYQRCSGPRNGQDINQLSSWGWRPQTNWTLPWQKLVKAVKTHRRRLNKWCTAYYDIKDNVSNTNLIDIWVFYSQTIGIANNIIQTRLLEIMLMQIILTAIMDFRIFWDIIHR